MYQRFGKPKEVEGFAGFDNCSCEAVGFKQVLFAERDLSIAYELATRIGEEIFVKKKKKKKIFAAE